jgi:hypothetical protein
LGRIIAATSRCRIGRPVLRGTPCDAVQG